MSALSPSAICCLVAVPVATTTDCGEAVGAVDRAVATRYERHLGLFVAVRAGDLGHCALAAITAAVAAAAVTTAIAAAVAATIAVVTVSTTGARGLLGGAAIGAATRLGIALLGKEFLLAFGECERGSAIAARKCLVCHCFSFSLLT